VGHEAVVREIVETCWSGEAGARRLGELVTADYVHHTVMGDWGLDQLVGGLAWVATRLEDRRYHVEHLVASGDMVAAYVSWSARRADDGTAVDGRGAYHCRFRDGLVAEDWGRLPPDARVAR
jgi:ketosteroid isomerase-like protein